MDLPDGSGQEDIIFKLEEERRQRRLQALDQKFQIAMTHLDVVAAVNEECYKAKKAVIDSSKTKPEERKPLVTTTGNLVPDRFNFNLGEPKKKTGNKTIKRGILKRNGRK